MYRPGTSSSYVDCNSDVASLAWYMHTCGVPEHFPRAVSRWYSLYEFHTYSVHEYKNNMCMSCMRQASLAAIPAKLEHSLCAHVVFHNMFVIVLPGVQPLRCVRRDSNYVGFHRFNVPHILTYRPEERTTCTKFEHMFSVLTKRSDARCYYHRSSPASKFRKRYSRDGRM
jgi:hypothetical protein